MREPSAAIEVPLSPQAWSEARAIVREYAQSLHFELCFQDFEAEWSAMESHYAAPSGLFLLAHLRGAVAACGGFRRLDDVDYPNACELKRLYVRPAFRRYGLGRTLTLALMDRARESGYSTMLLDTLDDMEAARELYVSLGFIEVPPYYFNPIPGAHYLKVDLEGSTLGY
jgi:putative acetyltransferase